MLDLNNLETLVWAFALFNIISGLLFLVAAAVYVGRRRSQPAAIGIAAFLMAWGVQVCLQNGSDIADDKRIQLVLDQLGILFILLQPITLLYAITKLPSSDHLEPMWRKLARYGYQASIAVAILAVLVFTLHPTFWTGETWGAAAPYLIHAPQFFGYAFGLYLLSSFVHEAEGPKVRRRDLLFAGLWIATAYQVLYSLIFPPGGAATVVVALASAGFAFVLVRHVLRTVRARQFSAATLALAIPLLAAGAYAAVRSDVPALLDVVFAPGLLRVVALIPLSAYVLTLEKTGTPVRRASRRLHEVTASAIAIPSVMAVAVGLLAPRMGNPTVEAYASTMALASGFAFVVWFFIVAFPDGATPLKEAVSIFRRRSSAEKEWDVSHHR